MKLGRTTIATATSVLLLGALAGCGGNAPASTATDGSTAAGGTAPDPTTRSGRPGASGTIAAVSDKTMQVQAPDTGQVAVTWTGSTTFTREADATLTDVAVGRCVLVGSDAAAASDGTASDTVAASSVKITQAVDGSCAGALAFGGGPQHNGGPGVPPPGLPSDRPTDGAGGPVGPGGMRPGTLGEVTAVGADGFTVAAVQPTPGATSPDTTPVAVTVDGATTYTKTVGATAADVAVGLCAMASGDTDSTGALAARQIGLSRPVDGVCGGGLRTSVGSAPGTQS
jgi:hypothetical protein